MTDLNNIRFLVEAADRGSFSAAARALGVPPSMVSRKIAKLEEDTGTRLFQRTTRSLRLTDAGQIYIEHVRSAMQSLTLAHALVGESSGVLRGRIRVSAPANAADALWNALSSFLDANPQVRIELELTDRYVDLVQEGFDFAIRAGAEAHGERLIGRRLFDAPRRLFASPKYLKARGVPRTVADLGDHDCVILGARTDRVIWNVHVGKRVHHVVVNGRVAVNEVSLAIRCAVDGFGIAFLSQTLCASHVKSGRLLTVLPTANAGVSGMWLVYPDRHLPPACRALADVLIRNFPAAAALAAK